MAQAPRGAPRALLPLVARPVLELGVRAFDAATGELSWETELARLHGPPTCTADGLLVPPRSGVALLDPASGAWRRGSPLDVLGPQVKRWVVVLEQGTFGVVGPDTVLTLRLARRGRPMLPRRL